MGRNQQSWAFLWRCPQLHGGGGSGSVLGTHAGHSSTAWICIGFNSWSIVFCHRLRLIAQSKSHTPVLPSISYLLVPPMPLFPTSLNCYVCLKVDAIDTTLVHHVTYTNGVSSKKKHGGREPVLNFPSKKNTKKIQKTLRVQPNQKPKMPMPLPQ